ARRGLGHDDEGDLAGLETCHALRTREDAALGRKDARHANEVAGRDAGGTERQLERGQLLAVLPDALREEHLLRDETDHVTLLARLNRGQTVGPPALPQDKRRPTGKG